ncbi:MAG: YtxH domain-containing protein [Planctomycetota bacterium]|nr:YtxH domain-containing protein [Planctomycetota bacterium]
MSDNNNNASIVPGICAAFAVGALVGVGLALLYAPRSGRETRELLAKKADDLKGLAGNALEQGKHLVGDVKTRAQGVFERGRDAAKDAVHDAAKNVEAATSRSN